MGFCNFFLYNYNNNNNKCRRSAGTLSDYIKKCRLGSELGSQTEYTVLVYEGWE